MKKGSEDKILHNKNFYEKQKLNNEQIKTTNVNILLNRVRLDNKKIFIKKIFFFSLIVFVISSIVFFLLI